MYFIFILFFNFWKWNLPINYFSRHVLKLTLYYSICYLMGGITKLGSLASALGGSLFIYLFIYYFGWPFIFMIRTQFWVLFFKKIKSGFNK
jgi:hypothetical protein